MGVAFERACHSLGLADATDSMTQIVALKIIETAKTGERDAVRLYDAVMGVVGPRGLSSARAVPRSTGTPRTDARAFLWRAGAKRGPVPGSVAIN